MVFSTNVLSAFHADRVFYFPPLRSGVHDSEVEASKKKASRIYCSTREYSFHMFIYACIFREYNDMIPRLPPSLSLQLERDFGFFFCASYICVYNQRYFCIVVRYLFVLENENLFFILDFHEESSFSPPQASKAEKRFWDFNDACVQVQLGISCLRLGSSEGIVQHDTCSSGSKIIYCIFYTFSRLLFI